jgi:putative transposase
MHRLKDTRIPRNNIWHPSGMQSGARFPVPEVALRLPPANCWDRSADIHALRGQSFCYAEGVATISQRLPPANCWDRSAVVGARSVTPKASEPLAGGKRSATTGWVRKWNRIPEGCYRRSDAMRSSLTCIPTGKNAMSTYASLHYHIVFSTKSRQRLIDPSWEDRLHEYLGGTIRGLDGFPQGIGGVEDHVHLLVGLKTTHCVADFVRELKKAASRWVHDELGVRQFAWQEGYGVFSASATARDRVKKYIANQREHHRQRSFREEFIELLERAGVEYDAKYLD